MWTSLEKKLGPKLGFCYMRALGPPPIFHKAWVCDSLQKSCSVVSQAPWKVTSNININKRKEAHSININSNISGSVGDWQGFKHSMIGIMFNRKVFFLFNKVFILFFDICLQPWSLMIRGVSLGWVCYESWSTWYLSDPANCLLTGPNNSLASVMRLTHCHVPL